MTEIAGEVADGFLVHAFSTPTYMREVTIPALLRGRLVTGAPDLAGFDIAGPVFACVGRSEQELQTAIAGTRSQIAFYASTPAYRAVLHLHGWGDLQPELTALSKQGRWSDMGAAIDDDVLLEFAVVGSPEEVGRGIVTRFDGLLTRATFYAPYQHDPAIWTEVLAAARSSSAQPQGWPGRSSTNRPSASATS
jgi:probable F420-dependent oxidoreductase